MKRYKIESDKEIKLVEADNVIDAICKANLPMPEITSVIRINLLTYKKLKLQESRNNVIFINSNVSDTRFVYSVNDYGKLVA